MIFVSDVHAAFTALRRLVETGEQVAILGDLANLTDYRTGEGAIADVLGREFARRSAAARADGDYLTMRAMWLEKVGDRMEDVRGQIAEAIDRQYLDAHRALESGEGVVIHGNVDRPDALRRSLPDGFRFVHGEVLDHAGLRLGFVGGGVATPLQAQGEVSDEEMSQRLDDLGPVDVLCTHVPAAVRSLRWDVVTGREERGSGPIRDYLQAEKPRFHLFGDVHQPKASTWRIGPTRCFNAGYFRATGRFLRMDGPVVQVAHLASLPEVATTTEHD